ncbi:MAG: hypothetical protein WA919_18005 [Coleofasciculaceae cyanobacterium]
MNKQNQSTQKKNRLVGTICSSLILSLPVFPLVASAQPVSSTNPCPRIYYEEPFNSTNLAPLGCPPNAAARQRGVGGLSPTDPYTAPLTEAPPAAGIMQPPLPETRSEAVARVTPQNQQVSVKLKNNTNTFITYEVIGQTGERVLGAGQDVMLQNLPLPVTLSSYRQDDGLLQVMPQATEPGMLEVMLEADPTFDDTKGTLRIQEDGEVFIN